MGQQVLGTGIFKFSMEMNQASMKQIASQLGQLSGGIKQVSASMTQYKSGAQKVSASVKLAEQNTKGFTKSLDGFSHEMFHAAAATGALSAGFIALGRSVGQAAFDFDRSMALVKAVTGETGTEMAKMTELARTLGRESEFGAARAAEGLLVLSRMGLNAAESMEVLTPAMKLAQAQQHDMAETSQLVVQQLKVFGKNMSEAEDVTDVLAATSSKTAADLEKLRLSLAYAGPIAALTGRSFEEVNTTLGLMFNAGIQASRAGTSLRFAFANLLNPTNRVHKALAKIGLTADDVNPSVKSMDEIFRTFADRMEGVRDKASLMFDIFGKRASTAMGAVINTVIRNRDAFSDLQESITDTDETSRQFAVQMDTFSGQMNLTRTAIQDMGIEFGQFLIPTLEMAGDVIRGVTEWFREMPDSMKQVIAFMFETATASTALVSGFTAFFYIGSIVGKALVGTSKAFNSLWKSMVAYRAVQKAAIEQSKAFSVILWRQGDAAVFSALQNRGLNKELASQITHEALLAASKKKTTAAQWKAYTAVIAQQGAAAGLNKQQIAQVIGAGRLILVNNGVSASSLTAATSTNIFSAAIAGLKGVLSGMLTVLGGWPGLLITIATIAIPAIITAIARFVGAQKKAQELTEQQTEALQKHLDKLKDVTRQELEVSQLQADVANKRYTAAEALQVLNDLDEKRSKINRSLIEQFPQLIDGYDKTTGKMIVNKKELKELMSTMKDMTESQKLDVELMGKTAEERKQYINDQIKALEKHRGVLSDAHEDNKKRLTEEEIALKKAREELKQYGAVTTTAEGANRNLAGEVQKATQNLEWAEEQLLNNQKAIVENEQKLEALNQELDGTKKETNDVVAEIEALAEGLGAAAVNVDKSAKRFDSLAKTMRDLNRWLQEIIDKSKLKIETVDPDTPKLIKDSQKVLAAFKKDMDDIDAKMEEATIKMKRFNEVAAVLKKQGKVVDIGNLMKAQIEYQEAVKRADEARIIVAERVNAELLALNKVFNRERVKDAEKHAETIADINKSIADKFGGNLDTRLNKLKATFAKEKAEIARQIVVYERLAEAFAPGTELGEGPLGAETLTKIQKKIDELYEYLGLKEEEFNTTKEKLTFDEFQKRKSRELAWFKIRNQNNLAQLNKERKIRQETVEWLAKHEKDNQEAYLDAVLTAAQAEQRYANELRETWVQIIGLAVKLGQIISEDEDIDRYLGMINDIAGAIKGFASQNYLEGAGNLLSFVGKIFDKIRSDARRLEEERQAALEKQKERDRQLTESANELAASSHEASQALVGLARQALGLGATLEEAMVKFDASIDEVSDIVIDALGAHLQYEAPVVGGQIGGLLSEISKFIDFETKQRLAADPVAMRNFIENLVTAQALANQGRIEEARTMVEELFGGVVPPFIDLTNTLTAREAALSQPLTILGGILNNFPDRLDDLVFAMSDVMGADALLDAQTTLYNGLTADNQNIIENLVGIRDEMQSMVEVTDNMGQQSLIAWRDYADIVEQLFERQLSEATTPEEVAAAFEERTRGLEFLGRSRGMWEQMSPMDKIRIGDLIDPEKVAVEMQDAIDSIGAQLIDPLIDQFQISADDIVDAFENGTLTFGEAISALNHLGSTIGTFPEEIRDSLNEALLRSRLAVTSGYAAKGTEVESVDKSFQNIIDSYENNIKNIDDNMNKVITKWQDLVIARKNLIQEFEKESEIIKDESEERISALEEERDAVLGIFDFTETQSVRSQRFARAREVEQKIIDEIVKASKSLDQLTEKYQKDLSDVSDQLRELTMEYGGVQNMYAKFAEQRSEAEADFISDIKSQIGLLEELGFQIEDGVIAGLDDGINSMDELVTLTNTWNNTIASAVKHINEATAGLSEMEAKISEINRSTYEKSISPIMPGAGKSAGTFTLPGEPVAEQREPMTSFGSAGRGESGTKPDYQSTHWYSVSAIKSNQPYSRLRHAYSNNPTAENLQALNDLIKSHDPFLKYSEELNDIVFAQNGFRGLIKRPTGFIAGENNRPELVSITPMSDLNKIAESIGTHSATNIHIHENIDLRGAYGVDNPSIARKVWNKVWAPARRRAVSNILDTRGKILR